MNEILVWRPFVEQGRIERRLIGHHVSLGEIDRFSLEEISKQS